MRTTKICSLVAAACGLFFNFVLSQTLTAASPSAALDNTFAIGSGAAYPAPGQGNWGQIQAVAVQPDGKVLAGGQALFTNFNGTPVRFLCRINVDGSLDTSFLTNLGAGPASGSNPGEINTIVLQPDGKILISGDFTTVNGFSRLNIARLNSDGSVDTGFLSAGGGAGGSNLRYVNDIALQADGKI